MDASWSIALDADTFSVSSLIFAGHLIVSHVRRNQYTHTHTHPYLSKCDSRRIIGAYFHNTLCEREREIAYVMQTPILQSCSHSKPLRSIASSKDCYTHTVINPQIYSMCVCVCVSVQYKHEVDSVVDFTLGESLFLSLSVDEKKLNTNLIFVNRDCLLLSTESMQGDMFGASDW